MEEEGNDELAIACFIAAIIDYDHSSPGCLQPVMAIPDNLDLTWIKLA